MMSTVFERGPENTIVLDETAPYSTAVLCHGWGFFSGQVGIAEDGTVPATFSAELDVLGENIRQAFDAAGVTMNGVANVTVYISDVALAAEFNAWYRGFFARPYPARVMVTTRFPAEFRVEIQMVAAVGG